MAQVDYFLKIEGVEGESKDSKHKNEIDVLSWSWGSTNNGTFGQGGGGGAGKVQIQDFHFSMQVCKASPKMFLANASGEHFKSATLTCRKAGKDQQEFLKYKFSDLIVSSYQTSDSSGGTSPTDQISLNFAKVEIEYKEQKADGSLNAPVLAGWDVMQNVKA